jgi:hypothetical protein
MAADRFLDHGDGTVTDTKTGLMWAAKDNGNLINWPNVNETARRYHYNRWKFRQLRCLQASLSSDRPHKFNNISMNQKWGRITDSSNQ